MKVAYEFTEDDLAAITHFHSEQSPYVRRQRWGCLFVGFVAMLVLPATILLNSDKPLFQTTLDIWPLVLGPFLFLAFAIPFIKWRMASVSKRMVREGQNAGFYGDCSFSLEADGLRETKSTGETFRKWSAIEKVVIAPKHLFVYTSGVEAFVVPRRAFATDANFDAFVQHIADHSNARIQHA